MVRRTDRYWAGLSSDLVIEQVLMRSMKTSGGLTRGREMTEQQQLIWLPMPACAEINRVMLELTGVSYSTSEQNKDMTKARQDTQTLLKYYMRETHSLLRTICIAFPLGYMPAAQSMLTQLKTWVTQF